MVKGLRSIFPMRSIYQLLGGNGKHFKPLLHIAHNMWTLILITVVSMNPPVYYYNPLAMTDTLAECEAMAANIRREESLKPVRILCTRSQV